jgi:NAD(P)-dependent dehydrogenase (short-subunit alcohol dehydrogenase family)
LTEGLAQELQPFGISVCCVEPGYTRTGFLNQGDHRVVAARQLDVYRGTDAARTREALSAYDNNQPGDVEKCAKVIVDVLTKEGVAKGRDVPVRLVLGPDCVDVIREKCESTLELLKEWEDISRSTAHDS